MKAKKLTVSSNTGTEYSATAKNATNNVTGDTTAKVTDANLYDIGADGLVVDAGDASTLTVLGTTIITVPTTPFITITNLRARNDVDRDTEAAIEGTTTTAAGDVAVTAAGNPTIRASMEASSIRTKSAEFGGENIPTKAAKGLAATLAVNVILGGVDAHISGGTVNANNVTVQARTDHAPSTRPLRRRQSRPPPRTRSPSSSGFPTATSPSPPRSR